VRAKQDRLNLGGEAFTVLPILHARRRGVRRPGCRRRDPAPVAAARLPHRRHGPRHRQQPGRLHDRAELEPRSSVYSTDVAKMIQAPIFHVNGDDPEACVRVGRAGLRVPAGVQQGRRHRHGVLPPPRAQRGRRPVDDPAADVQPHRGQAQVRKLYTESLIGRGDISVEEPRRRCATTSSSSSGSSETRPAKPSATESDGRRLPSDVGRRSSCRSWTARPLTSRRRAPRLAPDRHQSRRDHADRTSVTPSTAPEGFTVHPKLKPLMEKRAQMVREGGIDWGMGELLAFGSLLMEGTPVRLAGQDSRRGTFVQRHAVLIDKETAGVDAAALPRDDQAKFWVYDSLLSRVCRDGLRVRLLGRAPRRARAVGGPVR
jgi:2-oxoglutarate decarboxylase